MVFRKKTIFVLLILCSSQCFAVNDLREKRTIDFFLRTFADTVGYDVQKRPSVLTTAAPAPRAPQTPPAPPAPPMPTAPAPMPPPLAQPPRKFNNPLPPAPPAPTVMLMPPLPSPKAPPRTLQPPAAPAPPAPGNLLSSITKNFTVNFLWNKNLGPAPTPAPPAPPAPLVPSAPAPAPPARPARPPPPPPKGNPPPPPPPQGPPQGPPPPPPSASQAPPPPPPGPRKPQLYQNDEDNYYDEKPQGSYNDQQDYESPYARQNEEEEEDNRHKYYNYPFYPVGESQNYHDQPHHNHQAISGQNHYQNPGPPYYDDNDDSYSHKQLHYNFFHGPVQTFWKNSPYLKHSMDVQHHPMAHSSSFHQQQQNHFNPVNDFWNHSPYLAQQIHHTTPIINHSYEHDANPVNTFWNNSPYLNQQNLEKKPLESNQKKNDYEGTNNYEIEKPASYDKSDGEYKENNENHSYNDEDHYGYDSHKPEPDYYNQQKIKPSKFEEQNDCSSCHEHNAQLKSRNRDTEQVDENASPKVKNPSKLISKQVGVDGKEYTIDAGFVEYIPEQSKYPTKPLHVEQDYYQTSKIHQVSPFDVKYASSETHKQKTKKVPHQSAVDQHNNFGKYSFDDIPDYGHGGYKPSAASQEYHDPTKFLSTKIMDEPLSPKATVSTDGYHKTLESVRVSKVDIPYSYNF